MQKSYAEKMSALHSFQHIHFFQEWYTQRIKVTRQDKRQHGDTIGRLKSSINDIKYWMKSLAKLQNNTNLPLQLTYDIFPEIFDTLTPKREKAIKAAIEIAEAESIGASENEHSSEWSSTIFRSGN